MALIDLTAQTMVAVCNPWVDEEQDRSLLMSYGPIAGVLPLVADAQQALIDTRKVVGEITEQVMALTEKITKLDQTHDRMARGTYKVLDGAADLAKDEERQEELLDLRDRFFPDGLSVVKISYLAQAGNVRMVERQLTAGVRQKLAGLKVDGLPLDEAVDAWIEAGRELGDAFTKRARLRSQDDPDRVSAADLHQARLDWISAVNVFLSTLELTDIDADKKAQLLMPLREAERAAARPSSEDEVDGLEEPSTPIVDEV